MYEEITSGSTVTLRASECCCLNQELSKKFVYGFLNGDHFLGRKELADTFFSAGFVADACKQYLFLRNPV